ncbi:hypothetical protein [Burkholderia contaminans]|uniref:hypothetical protein n=1 Tax=Burkholderia contaminans TaxID=488447 RepID=UPI0016261309|nr:hypothetical protein [Burkholderia contaminans]
MEVETALIAQHLRARRLFHRTVFGDAATSAFFDDLVTFFADRILMEYEGIQTELEENL